MYLAWALCGWANGGAVSVCTSCYTPVIDATNMYTKLCRQNVWISTTFSVSICTRYLLLASMMFVGCRLGYLFFFSVHAKNWWAKYKTSRQRTGKWKRHEERTERVVENNNNKNTNRVNTDCGKLRKPIERVMPDPCCLRIVQITSTSISGALELDEFNNSMIWSACCSALHHSLCNMRTEFDVRPAQLDTSACLRVSEQCTNPFPRDRNSIRYFFRTILSSSKLFDKWTNSNQFQRRNTDSSANGRKRDEEKKIDGKDSGYRRSTHRMYDEINVNVT